MSFLLDTQHITVLQTKSQPAFSALDRRMNQHPASAFYYCVVSLHEQSIGAHAYINQATKAAGVIRGYQMLQRMLKSFCGAQLLAFDQGAADQVDLIRSQGVSIRAMDLRIAAIALANNCTVLTKNFKDFKKVPRLTVEDWTI